MPEAISNTSPLLYLHRVGGMEWMRQLFGKVLVPHHWMELTEPQSTPAEWLALDLGAGELAALTLAVERRECILLLDDALARRIAQAAGLTVWGTLRILMRPRDKGGFLRSLRSLTISDPPACGFPTTFANEYWHWRTKRERQPTRLGRKPFALMTFVFFALFPLSVAVARSWSMVLVAFIINGLREIGEPPRKAMIVDLADPAARGRTVGLYYLIRSLAIAPAAMVGGLLYRGVAPQAPSYLASAVGFVGVCVFALTVREDRANPAS